MRKMKFWLKRPRQQKGERKAGVLDRIRLAKTEDDVRLALEAGDMLAGASDGTVRKWRKAAASRLASIGGNPLPAGTAVEQA